MLNPRGARHPICASGSQPVRASEGIAIHVRGSKLIIIPDFGTDVFRLEACEPDVNESIQLPIGREAMFHVVDKLTSNGDVRENSTRFAELMFRFPKLFRVLGSQTDHVLDLDCGYGFRGIASIRLGFSNVIFVDSNMPVMKEVVWPNILLNCGENVSGVRCVVSTNWVALSEYLSDPGENR